MRRHPLGEHLPTCSSPRDCLEYRDLLTMGSEGYATYLTVTQGMLRTAATRGTFRVSQPRDEVRKSPSEWADDFGEVIQGYGSLQVDAPPDPYAPATRQAPTPPCPHDDPDYQPHGTPPDGYSIAIRRGGKK